MKKRRKFTPEQKAAIVLELICGEVQMSSSFFTGYTFILH